MNIPAKFDAIRPYEPEELPQVYDKLLQHEQFQQVLAYLYPQVPLEAIAAKMRTCTTNLEFQKAFCYGFLNQLLQKMSKGCDIDILYQQPPRHRARLCPAGQTAHRRGI